jgi:hypothetical protein
MMLSFLACSKDDDVKIENEGLYINEIYPSSGTDWIELFNAGDSDKDISAYKIYDDPALKYTLPAGTTIPAKGFLVLICDDTGVGLHTNFMLSSTGETITLENSSGKVIDKVTFPILLDGQSYGRFPDGTSDLGTTGAATQGTPNDKQAPLIINVTRTPIVPGLSESVTVNAEVVSNHAIEEVALSFRVNGDPFTKLAMTTTDGTHYQATIPALNDVGRIEYYVSATNTFNKTSFHPFDAPMDTDYFLLNTDPLPQLRINEFMASNSSCCPDTDGGSQEFDDWVEIYNAGATPVDVGGMYLSDNAANPFKSKISDDAPASTTIEPGGFLILWADEQGSQGPLHMNFKLSAAGEQIGLFYIDGRTIHSYTYGQQQENRSWGVTVNGGNSWQSFVDPTPGLSNN